MHQRIQFSNHDGKQVLLVDFSYCSAHRPHNIGVVRPPEVGVVYRDHICPVHHLPLGNLPSLPLGEQDFDVLWRDADVGMIQRRNRPRFAVKALFCLRVVREMRRENLDRDRAVEARVTRPIHLTHAARESHAPARAAFPLHAAKQTVPSEL